MKIQKKLYVCLFCINKTVMTVAGDEDQPMGICGVVSNGCI